MFFYITSYYYSVFTNDEIHVIVTLKTTRKKVKMLKNCKSVFMAEISSRNTKKSNSIGKKGLPPPWPAGGSDPGAGRRCAVSSTSSKRRWKDWIVHLKCVSSFMFQSSFAFRLSVETLRTSPLAVWPGNALKCDGDVGFDQLWIEERLSPADVGDVGARVAVETLGDVLQVGAVEHLHLAQVDAQQRQPPFACQFPKSMRSDAG